MSIVSRMLIAGALVLGLASAGAAEPLLTITEDGSAFVYKARPGDQPGTVAAMFGIGARDLPAFLAANGITDATHVGVGHVYRIPNPLAMRAADAEGKTEALERELTSLRTLAEQFGRDLDGARARAADAERRVARLTRLERLWPLVSIVGVLLLLTTAVLGWVARIAAGRAAVAERRVRALGDELDEKRRVALADRQQSARHILDLETKVRDLEQRLGAAAPAPAALRRSPAGTG